MSLNVHPDDSASQVGVSEPSLVGSTGAGAHAPLRAEPAEAGTGDAQEEDAGEEEDHGPAEEPPQTGPNDDDEQPKPKPKKTKRKSKSIIAESPKDWDSKREYHLGLHTTALASIALGKDADPAKDIRSFLLNEGQFVPVDIRRLVWENPEAGGQARKLDDDRIDDLMKSVHRRPLLAPVEAVVWDKAQGVKCDITYIILIFFFQMTALWCLEDNIYRGSFAFATSIIAEAAPPTHLEEDFCMTRSRCSTGALRCRFSRMAQAPKFGQALFFLNQIRTPPINAGVNEKWKSAWRREIAAGLHQRRQRETTSTKFSELVERFIRAVETKEQAVLRSNPTSTYCLRTNGKAVCAITIYVLDSGGAAEIDG